jgi:hypothetical protein
MSAKTKILIDCDPGHDDAVAILFAARHLDLVGITTVHGNNTVENTTQNALAVLELAGIDVPVAKGLAGPIAMKPVEVAGMHGRSGLDGATLPEPQRLPIATHAVDFIVRDRCAPPRRAGGGAGRPAEQLRRRARARAAPRDLGTRDHDHGRLGDLGQHHAGGRVQRLRRPRGGRCGLRLRRADPHGRLQRDPSDRVRPGDIDRMRTSGRRVAAVMADLMAFYLGRQGQTFGLTWRRCTTSARSRPMSIPISSSISRRP